VVGFALGAEPSYEDAINATASDLEPVDVYGRTAGRDLTDAQLSAPMANVLSGCNVPNDMKVTIRVAVRLGHAVGVTVVTDPHSGSYVSCLDRAVRKLRWPSSPRLDTLTTSF
jgi:hypothetical protein